MRSCSLSYQKYYNNARNEIKNKLDNVEKDSNNVNNNWKSVAKGTLTFVVQIIWVVIAAYILYKLGIQSPAVP